MTLRQTDSRKTFDDAFHEAIEPTLLSSATSDWIALLHQRTQITLSDLALPTVMIEPAAWQGDTTARGIRTGLQVDVHTGVPAMLPVYCGITLHHFPSGTALRIPVARNAHIWPIGFSHDATYFAFLQCNARRVVLSWAECSSGSVRSLQRFFVNGATLLFGRAAAWLGTTHRLVFCSAITGTSHRPFPIALSTDAGSANLWDWYDHAAGETADWRRYMSCQLAITDVSDGATERLGHAGFYESVVPSPSGEYLLVTRREETGKSRSSRHEIWRPKQAALHVEDVPENFQAVIRPFGTAAASGPSWHANRPHTLVGLERGITGQCIVGLAAPFDGVVETVYSTNHRVPSYFWTTANELIVAEESSADRRLTAVGDGAAGAPFLIQSLEHRRRPGERLELVCDHHPGGRRAYQIGNDLVMAGENHDGRTHVSRVNITTGVRENLFVCLPGEHPRIVAGQAEIALVTGEAGGGTGSLWITDVNRGTRRPLLANGSQSVVRAVHREPRALTCTRRDGATFTAFMQLPTASGASSVPCFVWIDPVLPNQAAWRHRRGFDRSRRRNPHLALTTRGYAVVHADWPFDNLGACPAETVVTQQLVTLDALIAALRDSGLIDPNRLAVGGLCLGAYVAAVLLAHTSSFRAGVLRSGMFNLTMTNFESVFGEPFSRGESGEVLLRLSPISMAPRIDAPVLLVCGQKEGPPVEARAQSVQLFNALAHHGRTGKLVVLPREGHTVLADESLLHLTRETADWCDRYV